MRFGLGLLVLSTVIIGIFAVFPELLTALWGVPRPREASALGDAFNILNALFSGFALLGVITAIVLQSKELALQREELRDTRAELRRAAEAQERLELTSTKQLDREMAWSRKRVALDLYKRWHGREMALVRAKMSRIIIEVLEDKRQLRSLNDLAYVREAEARSLFRFVQFFEQLALLKEKELVDSDLLLRLFGPYLKFYGNRLLRPLRELPEHPDFIGRLQLIDEQLLQPADQFKGYVDNSEGLALGGP
jgi:hypothetical protein